MWHPEKVAYSRSGYAVQPIVRRFRKKPAHGKLKRLNITAYEYTPKARYKGSDTFAIKAAGQGPAGSGTSVITVRATIK
jgi:hypothetical protein